MRSLNMRGAVLGRGRPKICVPLVGQTLPTLLREATQALASPADVVEWRADCFADALCEGALPAALAALRNSLGNMPLLFTYRTKPEGGQGDATPGEYLRLNLLAARCGMVDALDIELAAGEDAAAQLVEAARQNEMLSILSSHCVSHTPDDARLAARLAELCRHGADLPKLACMAASFDDTLRLMAAANTFVLAESRPVIALAMGPWGRLSRVAGQFFGSALTFASLAQESAPGQLPAEETARLLALLAPLCGF